MLREQDTAAHVEPTKITMSAFLDRWINDYVGVNIQKFKTREYYTSIVRTHLRPKLGTILLTKLTAAHVQSYYRDALDGGLSSSSVHGHHRTLHRFHDLRHTSASLLLGANVNAKIVSERLGHSSIGITLDTYSHVLPTMQRDASDTLGRILAAQ